MIKVGMGYDVHQLSPGKPLLIGGVKVISSKGSVGHSDGDALLHAITDAILGAVGLGDIGLFFPSDDETWRGADSKIFLIEAVKMISEKGYIVNNVDSTVILQSPKLQKYIPQIRKSVAQTLLIDETNINIKATTTDKLGVIGEGLGWACMAVVSVKKIIQ